MDETFQNVVKKVAEEHNIDYELALKIIKFQIDDTVRVIKSDQVKTIKWDYFGKFYITIPRIAIIKNLLIKKGKFDSKMLTKNIEKNNFTVVTRYSIPGSISFKYQIKLQNRGKSTQDKKKTYKFIGNKDAFNTFIEEVKNSKCCLVEYGEDING